MNQQRGTDKIQERILRQGRRPVDEKLLGSSRIRIMLGWVFSLGIISVVANLPFYADHVGIGWRSVPPIEQIVLLPMPPEEKEADPIDTSPITVFTQPVHLEDPLPETELKTEEREVAAPEIAPKPQRLERLDRGPILEFVDENPVIIGGLSTLYLSIDYPKSARDQGIEGLTVISFVVEKDGSTHNIEVMKPLHPALDSAAVVGVRNTLFKPGRQNGKVVRVKMRLPIRFKLINPDQKNTVDSLTANSHR